MATICCLHADSIKTNGSSMVGNLKLLVDGFKEANHRLPESWGEMAKSGFISRDILRAARNYLDFENRYRFLVKRDSVVISTRDEKIIVMAIASGAEGNARTLSDADQNKGRWLIVEMPTGEIETRNYPEIVLEKLFKNAGFDLADYTGPGGKWMPIEKIPDTELEVHESRIRTGHDVKHGREDRVDEKLDGELSSFDGTDDPAPQATGSWPRENWMMLAGISFLLISIIFVKSLHKRS